MDRTDQRLTFAERILRFILTNNCWPFYTVAGAAAALLYAWGLIRDLPELLPLAVRILFAGVIIFIVHFNQRKLYGFLHITDNISHVPMHQIRLMNNLFLTFFTAAALAMMYYVPFLPYQKVLSTIWIYVRVILHYVLGIFFREGPRVTAEEVSSGTPDFSSMFPAGTARPNKVLAVILTFLTKALFYLVMLYLLYRLVCFLYRKLSKLRHFRLQDSYADVYVTPLVKHEKLKRKKDPAGKKLWRDFSTEGKIRKLYKKTILHGLGKKSVSAGLTPSELEALAGLPDDPYTKVLHDTYEKARYSESGCTPDDLKPLRK